ncbi:MAG: hypothetical protein EBR67_03710 [Proteobacteria bacterium]|nr:hypothetical protein [Pseudomonadota bacterium]
MAGSLIVNSSGTGNNFSSNTGSYAAVFDQITSSSSNTDTQTTYDSFSPAQVFQTTESSPKAETTETEQDPQLTKILGRSELVRLYELKLSGETKDGERNLDEAIKAERDKIGVNNADINKYIEHRRKILEELGQAGEASDKVIAALDQINSLPEELKKSIHSQLKTKLTDSSAIAKSAYNVDQVLDGDYAGILKANPEIAKSISKSLKTLSSDEAFTKSLENNTVVSDEDSFNAKLALGGSATVATALGVGFMNSWNPVGWIILGGTALTLAGAAISTESTRRNIADSLGILGKARIS